MKKSANSVRKKKPTPQKMVKVSDLWVGDRFTDEGRLYTLLGFTGDGKTVTARHHGEECINLRERGLGYIGDSSVSFQLTDRVRYQPPTAPSK